jgi:hypothetical protein
LTEGVRAPSDPGPSAGRDKGISWQFIGQQLPKSDQTPIADSFLPPPLLDKGQLFAFRFHRWHHGIYIRRWSDKIPQLDGHPYFHHGGGIPGFVTELVYFPEDELTVVVLTNAGRNSPKKIADQIARLILN